MQIRIIDRNEFCRFLGISASSFYQRQAEGLLPEAFKTETRKNHLHTPKNRKNVPPESTKGKNSWGEHEAQLMILAKMRGDSEDEIRSLVCEIEERRNQSYNDICAWYELRFSESRREVAA
jgi:hypothetical protein